ncbi:3-hydroxyisobutyrate dehydrogenase [Arboricoccus pini]|uniref:L-threonate dehydrogenase n=1 Tax=Arboricoccus pini TaxID=1963835 RepID=A0A212RNL2_9PROT|nr:3-hydroxyisobutyrate dehydrogenase [Arboricoccus pini]
MNKTATASQVAVIGLGSMGGGMARALLAAGFRVKGFDVNPTNLEAFAAAGGTVAASAALAVQDTPILVSVVVNAHQTENVLFGAEGCLAAMPEESVVISSATMAPEAARDLARRVEATGRHYLDAPISGGATRAAEGALTILAAGSKRAFTMAGPAIDAMAAKVYELGDAAGTGAAFKMINQLLAGVHIAAACEAISFAARQGLDLARVFEVITGSAGNSWMFENRIPHVLEGDYAPRSAIEIFTKDLGIIADMGRSTQFPTPMAGAALQLFLMTAAAGMGKDDDASVARLFARIAGIDLPGQV